MSREKPTPEIEARAEAKGALLTQLELLAEIRDELKKLNTR